ncbi:patatin-like phospholipase [Aureococcus anophagefferens]|nr:patatin-like phospholipase [Aureococcus anophagefferens]
MDEMDDETEDKKMLNREAMMHNMSAIDGCRSYLTIFAGVARASSGSASGDSMAYTNEAIPNHVIGGVGKYGLSFVLFWTLRRRRPSLTSCPS